MGFPIRKSPDQSLFAAPRSLSQRTTSFIASSRQGIHQTPFSRLIASRKTTGGPFAVPHVVIVSRTFAWFGSDLSDPCFPGPRSRKARSAFLDLERRDGHSASPADLVAQSAASSGTRPASLSSRCQGTLGRLWADPKGPNEYVGVVEDDRIAALQDPRGARTMVEPAGIEPATLCLQSRCSPS